MTDLDQKPRLRFKGFTEAWEQRKLGDIFEFERPDKYMIKDDHYEETGIPVLTANKAFILGYKNETGAYSKGDCIIFDDFTLDSKYVDFPYKINSSVIKILTSKDNSNLKFDYYLLNQAKILQQGHARHYISVVQPTIVNVPQKCESSKIEKLFTNFDNLITLHQRKYEKLKSMKTALLEKMFPAGNDTSPKIRFKGFTEAWEQRKLGDIASIVGGGTPSTINNNYWGGSINWFSPVEIGNEIYVSSSQNKITKEGYDNCSAKLLPVGTILFTSRAGIGKTAILTVKGCTNQGFQSIVPNIDKLDSYFIYSKSDELKKYGEAMGAGSTFVEVSGKQMAEMKLMMPSTLKEQQVIGNFFKNLDHLITLHQRKCEKLKNLKKSLLERMFI